MIYETIDLYEYFGETKPAGGKGTLTCMALSRISNTATRRVYPAILVIPGGAYRFVCDREAEPVALGYMNRGFSAFILDYAVAPECCWPVAFREAVMAMMYIRENAERYSIDPAKVAAIGFSAGGHLCGCLAALTGDRAVKDLAAARGVSPKPDAVIFSYPVITSGKGSHEYSINNISGKNRLVAKHLSIEERIDADSVPAFIWHTRGDETVPVVNSLLLAAAYEKAGVDFALHIFEKGKHGLSTADGRVYNSAHVPEHSTDLPRWLEMSLNWLADRGICISDDPDDLFPDK